MEISSWTVISIRILRRLHAPLITGNENKTTNTETYQHLIPLYASKNYKQLYFLRLFRINDKFKAEVVGTEKPTRIFS